ncbi:hypothetical protein GCM10008957_46860 [Deinococcus ruber]|uniref:Uncharacterized protein n=1 Tax=Deinococcus ruber TaxID=1848197 RepID=A0A918FDS2_9DEIO|nr:hypothetical protein GCM10008957_46860 [Deinococcus ruber]
MALLLDNTSAASSSNPMLSSASVAADGTFTLPLPSLATITPYLTTPSSATDVSDTNQGCTGALVSSDPSGQAFGFSLLRANNNVLSTTHGLVNQATLSATLDGYDWVYQTKAQNITGSVTCVQPSNTGSGNDTLKITSAASMHAGWNLVKLTGTLVGNSATHTVTTTLALSTVADQHSTWFFPGDTLTTQSLGAQGKASLQAAMTTATKILLGK